MLLVYSTLIVFIAFLGQSIFGFGGGLLAIPLLSLAIPVRDAVLVVLVFQLMMGLLIVKTRKDTPWNSIRPLGLGLFTGTVLGISSLAIAPENFLRALLLAFILVYLLRVRIFADVRFPGIEKRRWTAFTGLVGGYVQGVLGTGGPIFVIYLNETVVDKIQFRAAVILILFLSNIVRLCVAVPTGLMEQSILDLCAIALPFFLIALVLGQKLHVSFSDHVYRSCIQLLLLISAISLSIKIFG